MKAGKKPFLELYGHLEEFLCLLGMEVKYALFTATATRQTKNTIIDMLNIDEANTFFVEKNPDHRNIRYCIEYVDINKEVHEVFDKIIRELQERKEKCAGHLKTGKQCSSIYSSFCAELGDNFT